MDKNIFIAPSTASSKEKFSRDPDSIEVAPQGEVYHIEEIDVVPAESLMSMRC